MPTIEGFLIRYPEFKNAPQERLEFMLEDAKLLVYEPAWQQHYKLGVYALMGHMLYIGYGKDGNGTTAPLPAQEKTSKSAGALSVGYGSARAGFEGEFGSYASTTYGQRYLELLRIIRPTARVY